MKTSLGSGTLPGKDKKIQPEPENRCRWRTSASTYDVQIKYLETSTAYVCSTQFISSHSPKKTGLSAFSVKEALAKTQGMPAGPLGQRLATSAAPTLA